MGASNSKIRICTKNGFWVCDYEFLHCSECKKPPFLNARRKGQPGKYGFYDLSKKYIYAIDTKTHKVIRSYEEGNMIDLYDFKINEDSEEGMMEDSSGVVGLKAKNDSKIIICDDRNVYLLEEQPWLGGIERMGTVGRP
jgi:hypothetical protein